MTTPIPTIILGYDTTMDGNAYGVHTALFTARGIKEILLKRGEQGASHYSADGRLDAAPIAVREDDPTGAGDSFGGAYIALRLNGHDAASALRYANAAGARAVTRIGPMEGTSTLAELDALLIAHKNN